MALSSKLLLKDLDEAVSRGSAESRENARWYATDVLMVGSAAGASFGLASSRTFPLQAKLERGAAGVMR